MNPINMDCGTIAEFSHPECLPGEIFLSNADVRTFKAMPFASKRLGVHAYDGRGYRLHGAEDWFPVFVLRHDIVGQNLGDLRQEWQL